MFTDTNHRQASGSRNPEHVLLAQTSPLQRAQRIQQAAEYLRGKLEVEISATIYDPAITAQAAEFAEQLHDYEIYTGSAVEPTERIYDRLTGFDVRVGRVGVVIAGAADDALSKLWREVDQMGPLA